VNDVTHDVSVDPEMPLMWVLRDHLRLLGTKASCGVGLCGACTVHVDGEAQRSCVLPVQDVVGKSVTTIEGLANIPNHPVIEAWIEQAVPQCGYCQSGFIMATAALLKNNPDATEQEVNETLSNICRCSTYVRVRNAVKAAQSRSRALG